jgi:hypothetical protein
VDPSATFFQQLTALEVMDDDCSRPYPLCLAYQLDHDVSALEDRKGWLAEWKRSTPWWASDTSPGMGTWPPPDQPDIGDGVMRRAARARRDHRRAGPGEAGDTMDTRGLEGLGEGHRRQHGGESSR